MTGTEAVLPRAESRYFGPAERPRFGFLHFPPATAPSRSVGIVICGALGYEGICAHRGLRHFAERAAALGFPALRFDYDGTWNSAGDELEPDRWQAWCQSAREAAVELRQAAGVERVCFLGVRAGALIATAAANRAHDVAGLAIVAPVSSGRSWLREMRALRATLNLADAPPEFALSPDVEEGVGLTFSDVERDAIVGTSLDATADHPPREVLWIDRADRPPLQTSVERFRAAGATVTHTVLPGFEDMMLDPHESVVPAEMLLEWEHWLDGRFPPRSVVGAATPPRSAATQRSVVAPGVEEQAHSFGQGGRLFGITAGPAQGSPKHALLLLNSGAIHHVGFGGLYVRIARRLAARGWLVLRYDVSGIGESLPHPGADENVVYSPHAVADLGAAVEFLQSRYALSRIEAAGLCSGAYHAFKGAVAGVPLHGVVVANPLVFFWKPGMSLKYPAHHVLKAAADYRRSMFQASKWLNLLREQRDISHIPVIVGHWFADWFRARVRGVARLVGIPVADDLAAELRAIRRRGIALRFLFSEDDPGELLLRSEAGAKIRRLQRRGAARLDRLAGCDHSLSARWMQEAFWTTLARYLNVS